jgi:hypothetical protein
MRKLGCAALRRGAFGDFGLDREDFFFGARLRDISGMFDDMPRIVKRTAGVMGRECSCTQHL